MNRDEIVYSTYEAGKRLNRLKATFGLIDSKTAESVERRLEGTVRMMKEIDQIMAIPNVKEREIAFESISRGRLSLQNYSMSTICEKKELEWPTQFLRMNFFKILKTLLMRRKPNVSIPSSKDAP
jgi:hypothetical protein